MIDVKKDFDGFNIHLTIDEDGEWQANFVELPNVSAFSSSPEKTLNELKIAWGAMKASYRKHKQKIPVAPLKKEYSGQFNIRVNKHVHCALAVEAAQSRISLNSLVAQTLAQHVKLHNLEF